MPARGAPVVIICDDVGAAPAPLDLAAFAARLARELPSATVLTGTRICRAPNGVAGALVGIRPRRAVVACRAVSDQGGNLLNGLRLAGVTAGRAGVVDLRPTDALCETAAQARVVFEQSVALVRAEVARVLAVDLDAPTRERTSFTVGKMSRRFLLGGVNVVRQPVAVWQAGNCGGGSGCTACILSCPRTALSRQAGRVVVSAELCTGCGACVSACRSGALTLAGAGLDSLEAAAGNVAHAARRGAASGVAVACRHSSSAPRLGERWLVLGVPSLEMVTAGWLLRLAAAGVGTELVACDQDSCSARADALDGFLGAIAHVARSPANGTRLRGPVPPTVDDDAGIGLREPEATMQSLAALGLLAQDRAAWSAEGSGCPLGEVEIDLAACSFCGVCARWCPTGALAAERDGAGSLRLSFDPGSCTACGACEASCPEQAVSVQRRADGASLAAGRRLIATEPPESCETCGALLVARLPAATLSRFGGSHPYLRPGARRICADCRLRGPTLA